MAITLKIFFMALFAFGLAGFAQNDNRQVAVNNATSNIVTPSATTSSSSSPTTTTSSNTTTNSSIISSNSSSDSVTTHSDLSVDISSHNTDSSSSINIDTGSSSGQPSETPGVSGIKGIITISPACAIGATKCTQPFYRQIIITNSSGAEVARVPAGSINIKLAPGKYTLSPVKSSSNSGHFNQTYAVTVNPNMFTTLNISISGN